MGSFLRSLFLTLALFCVLLLLLPFTLTFMLFGVRKHRLPCSGQSSLDVTNERDGAEASIDHGAVAGVRG